MASQLLNWNVFLFQHFGIKQKILNLLQANSIILQSVFNFTYSRKNLRFIYFFHRWADSFEWKRALLWNSMFWVFRHLMMHFDNFVFIFSDNCLKWRFQWQPVKKGNTLSGEIIAYEADLTAPLFHSYHLRLFLIFPLDGSCPFRDAPTFLQNQLNYPWFFFQDLIFFFLSNKTN